MTWKICQRGNRNILRGGVASGKGIQLEPLRLGRENRLFSEEHLRRDYRG